MIIAFPQPLRLPRGTEPGLRPAPNLFFYCSFALDCLLMSKTCAIIPAAGRGVRMGNAKPKQFLELSGRPILLHTLETFSRVDFLSGILLVVPKDFCSEAESLVSRYCADNLLRLCYLSKEELQERCSLHEDELCAPGAAPAGSWDGSRKFVTLTLGGTERQDSVFNALQALPGDCQWVLIHDGVRPFVSSILIENTWKAARKTGAAIAALPATDTVKRVRDARVGETLPRDEIWLVQTPQVFRKDILLTAYLEARRQGCSGTDDAFFVERLGLPVAVVPGERSNIKVTTQEDLVWGSFLLTQVGRQSDSADKVG